MEWRDIPSLAALRAFEAAVRHTSLTAAAAELNVTHAAIAQHVRTIEAQLQTPLLLREGRGMTPTAAGSALARSLSDGFAQIIAGVTAVQADASDRPLSVTCTPSFAENWLMPRLGAFWAQHPEVTVSVTPSNDVADLRRDPFDMGIRYGRGVWPDINAEFLVQADYIVVAAPSLLGDRTATSFDDLQDLPWIFENVHKVHRRWAQENGLKLTECRINEFATLSMVLSAVRAGVGVSVVSRPLVADDIAQGRLVSLYEEVQDGLGYYIVTQKGVTNAKAAVFRKWLKSVV